ncbi:helix-turn-helix transcriptional regulator [Aeromicrobium sp. CF4.19]|uniref:helix-turn-helix transcriptional regulator n=1 Tax=Aeromicrobium sp. CF4.19 TaxID=3373082 RepID=UPI003EE57ED2
MHKHLRATDVAARWGCSRGWLANLRSAGEGPPYVKIGSSVLYRLVDLEEYEAERLVVTA